MKSYLKLGEWNAVCSSCEEEKDISAFYLHSNGKPRKQCKECRNTSNTAWKKKNPEVVKQYEKTHREEHHDECMAAQKRWRQKNGPYNAFRCRTYDFRKRSQIPSWANLNEIKQIYLACPKGLEVDHIIPLKGKLVSGLHVENNLQYLTPRENRQKRNTYEIIP